jgi:hypothetical protein
MTGTYRPSRRETFLLDERYVLSIEQGVLPAEWLVHTGHSYTMVVERGDLLAQWPDVLGCPQLYPYPVIPLQGTTILL